MSFWDLFTNLNTEISSPPINYNCGGVSGFEQFNNIIWPPISNNGFIGDMFNGAGLLENFNIPQFDFNMPDFNFGFKKSSLKNSNSNLYKGASALKPGLFKGTLKGKEVLVTNICKKYGVDPGLVAAIIGIESGYGTSAKAKNYNYMGYRAAGDLGKDSNGHGKFSSAEKGLDAAIGNLARYTRFSDVKAVNFNNLNAIGRHYCETSSWAAMVRKVYNTRVKEYLA